MATIVALGGGRFDNGEMYTVAEHIVSLSGKKNPSVVFLPTAGFDRIEAAEEALRDTFLKLGCSRFEPLFLTDETLDYGHIEQTILGCDILYAGGGNLQFMMDTLRKTGADKALRKAYDKGTILSGFSSGAICWFTGGYDDCGPDKAYIFLECLGFLPRYYCPHYISESWQSFEKRLPEVGSDGIGVEDGAALVYRDGHYYCICGNEDGDVFFMPKAQNYKKINITADASILE
ncbi:MAG: Type 1 glutamine amidotransferase-like domain-containing protein [Acutalibacteraceae bacterium]